MERINIICTDKIKVQSSLDFYLGIVSLGDIKNIKELRKSMFAKFMSEYKERNYPLVNVNKSTLTDDISEDIEDHLDSDTSEYSTSANNFLNMLQKLKSSNTTDEIEESEEDGFINNNDSDEYNISEEDADLEESEELLDAEDVDMEDTPLEDTTHNTELLNSDFPDKEAEVQNNYTTNYSEHGIYIEDIIDGTEKIEKIDYGDNTSCLDNSDQQEYNEDLEDLEEPYFNDDIPIEDNEYGNNESDQESRGINEGLEEGNQNLNSTDFISTKGNEVEKPNYTPNENTLQFKKEQDVQKEVSIEDDGFGADVPSDIRTFIKQHPNSDVSFVLKFYPQKEINKQLKLGRIYKKKGKLFI